MMTLNQIIAQAAREDPDCPICATCGLALVPNKTIGQCVCTGAVRVVRRAA